MEKIINKVNFKSPNPRFSNNIDARNNYCKQKVAEIGYSIGSDISKLVESIGGRINYQKIDDWYNSEDGSIEVYADEEKDVKFDIFISRFTGPLRNRFTIAHELGHYYLHSDEGKKRIKAARFGSGPAETEANYFAAELLMPEKQFRNAWKHFEKDIDSIAGRFLVSSLAVSVRVDVLNLN